MRVFIVFIGFLIFSLSAQVLVKGKVLEKDSSEPLPYVKVWHQESGTVTHTDGQGNFLLQLPKAGSATISVSFMGMVPQNRVLKTENGQSYDLVFNLADEMLDDVVVESDAMQKNILRSTTSVEAISLKFLEDKNTINVKTALDSKPGLNILDGEAQIRGGSGFTMGVGSKVAVVVDGIPLLSGDAGQPQWDFVPLENLESIQIIKGASSALYSANAMSGVIVIQTAYPTLKPQTKISANMGWYDTPANPAAKWWTGFQGQGGINFLHSRIIDKNWDLTFGGSFQYDMGYLGSPNMSEYIKKYGYLYPNINNNNAERPVGDYLTDFSNQDMHNQRYRFNLNTRYRFESIKGLSVALNSNIMNNQTSNVLAWLDYDENLYRAYPGAVFLQNQWTFNIDPSIRYVNQKGTVHALNFRYLFADNQVTNDQDNQTHTAFAEYQNRRKFSRLLGIEMTSGVNFTNVYSQSQIYTGEDGKGNRSFMNAAVYMQFDKDFQFDRLFLNSITLSAGGRLEYFNLDNKDEDFAPIARTSINFEILRGSFLRFAYGMGYRFPTIAEKYINTGVGLFGVFPNERLTAEDSHNLEVGFKQGFQLGEYVKGYGDIAYFYSIYNNTIEYLFGIWETVDANGVLPIPFAGFKFMNTGASTVKGIDASLYTEIKLSRNKEHQLTMMGGYTWILPQSADPNAAYNGGMVDQLGQTSTYINTSVNTDNLVLKYRFLHTLKFDVDYNFKAKRNPWLNISAGVSGRFFSKMENMDKSILDLQDMTAPWPTGGIIDPENQTLYPELYFKEWLENGNNGAWIFDIRVGYEFSKFGKLSFIVNNVANLQYALRPLKIEAPRSFAFQYSITL